MLAQRIHMLKTYLAHSTIIIPDIITHELNSRNIISIHNHQFYYIRMIEIITHLSFHHHDHAIHHHNQTGVIADTTHHLYHHHIHITYHHSHQFTCPHSYLLHRTIVHQHNSHPTAYKTSQRHQYIDKTHSDKFYSRNNPRTKRFRVSERIQDN